MTDDGLEAFCAREHPRLLRMLRLYCGDENLAQELAQEALVRAVARWPKIRRLESPGGWTYRVAINLANSRFRRRGAARRALQRLQAEAVPPPDASDVDEVLMVRALVADIPVRQRQALVLCHLVGMEPAETARVMGCSAQAVRNLTHRARQQLREGVTERQEVDDVR